MHRLLARQVKSATSDQGDLEIEQLLNAVSIAYDESDRERQRTDRSVTLMIEEVDQLNAELLASQERRFEAAINNMAHGLSMFDSEYRLVVCNDAYIRLYDMPEALTQPGTSFWDMQDHGASEGMVSNKNREEHKRSLEREINAGKPFKESVSMVNGAVIRINHQPLADGGWLTTHEDVTEQHRSEVLVRYLARHDNLTGLINRSTFLELLVENEDDQDADKITAVMCIDLDHFKPVNDSFGHAVGDAVLQKVAELVRVQVGDRGEVSRFGGDEFAILLEPLSGAEEAAGIAGEILAVINKPIRTDGLDVNISASIGIAMVPRDGSDSETLMRNGDLALHRAKSDGRNRFCFFEREMDELQRRRRVIEKGLVSALADGNLELSFQPLVSLKDNCISCCEALMRWDSPPLGLVSPVEFIPVAEETGIIKQMGAWALRTACKQAIDWPENVRVAVNVSPMQFKGDELIGQVKSALELSGLDAGRLELEITESLFLDDDAHNLEVLHALRDLGVRFSLDDFGTGYSSLSYLRMFPFDKIKIDRSFISNMTGRCDTIAIVKAIVEMGTGLGMTVTSEGIETEEQLNILKSQGCTEVQGYLFSPPLPQAVINDFVSKNSAKDALRIAS